MIIGLVGNKGVGKDTVADYLVIHNYQKFAFAGILKEATKILFNWSDEKVINNKELLDENWNVTPREILQLLGTECLRDIISPKINTTITFNGNTKSFSFHVKRLFLDIKELIKLNQNIVISDIRFQDEIDFVKFIGGNIIKIDRKIEKNKFSQHKSENYVDKLKGIDSIIDNNSTLKKLYDNIHLLLL